MSPVTKKRRTDLENGSASEASSDAGSVNAASDEEIEIEDEVVEGSSDESGDEAEVEETEADGKSSADSKKRKQKKPRNAMGVTSEQEKAQAVSDMYEYKSNVFRMETEELLKEVRLSYQKRMAPAEKVLHKLKSVIEALPERLDIPIDQAEKEMRKRKISIPFPDPKPATDVMYKFSYSKPSYINVVGGYALKTAIKQSEGFSIDLVLTMPSEIFQEKDYLNYRYFHKRAYYLAYLAAGIQRSKDLGVKLTIDYVNDDLLRPILVVSPSGDGSELDFTASKCTIRLIPAAAKDKFVTRKLLPTQNCVRPAQAEGDAEKAPRLDPTPSYNSSLLADTTYFPHLSQLHAASESCTAFKDACILGRVWLRQRGFGGNFSKGGFGHFEWAILIAFLLKGGGSKGHSIVSPGYSNYQMFKAIIQFLATRDLVANPLIFNAGEEVRIKDSQLPVLFDGSNGLNILFKMTPWSYKLLKHEATTTVKLLNDTASDNFDSIFLNRVDEPYSRFDSIAHIPISTPNTELEPAKKNPGSINDQISYSQKLYDVLVKGLGDRVSLIHLSLPPPVLPALGLEELEGTSGVRCITVGFLLDAAQCSRVVDHGPPAEYKKEAAEYRKFWGPKSDLRRFKDGSILESVVWTGESEVSIFNQIIQYIVRRHVSAEAAKNITFIGDEFARLLPKSRVAGSQTTSPFQPTMSGFDTLVKDLRDLEGLPLQLRQVSAVGASLRYSAVYIPLVAADGTALMEPADVVVQFESSLKWPEDLVAVQNAKIAFLLKMAELLEKVTGKQKIHTRIGLENENRPTMNAAFLDIIYLNGCVFRVRIYHDRERDLLERQLKDKSLSPRTRDEISKALSEHCREFIYGPLHTQDLQKLCHRFPALSPTIRLVKKWFHSHLLSPHISEELMELVTLRCFINPSPWATPSSVMTGFLRTILFLSQWDWRTEPLIVDMSTGDLKASDVEKITEKFDTLRKNDPVLNRVVLFAATNHNQDGTIWTESGRPAKVVAARMTSLARSAWESAKKSGTAIDIGNLFVPSMKDYDFVIHLNRSFSGVGIRNKKQQSVFKNLQKTEPITGQDIAKLALDPVKLFLSELSMVYGDNLIFFTDDLAGSSVGCLWSPLCTSARDWKVNLSYSTIPAVQRKPGEEKKPELLPNKKAMLNEIARLGGELVTKIDVNRE